MPLGSAECFRRELNSDDSFFCAAVSSAADRGHRHRNVHYSRRLTYWLFRFIDGTGEPSALYAVCTAIPTCRHFHHIERLLDFDP